MSRENDRLSGDLDHRNQVFQRLVLHLVDVRIAHDRVGSNQDRVSIRLAFCDGLNPDIAVRAGTILHQNLLTEGPGEAVRDYTGGDVRRATRREWYDDVQWARRPVLCGSSG